MLKLEWELVDKEQYPGDFWEDWELLFSQYHSENPMLDRRFVETLINYYPQPAQIARGFVQDKLAALLILETSQKGVCRNYAPSQTPVALLLATPDAAFNFPGLLNALDYGCLRLDLYFLDPNEHPSILNQRATYQKYGTNIQLDIEGDFQTYWSSRSKKLQQNIKRYFNRLKTSDISLDLRAITAELDIEAATDRYGILESQGWKGKNGTALHPSNQQGQFYRALLKRFAKDSQALVYESYMNDKLAASRLCIHNKGTLITLKTTYDENLKKYAAGKILLYSFINHLFQTRLSHRIDFYTNATKEQISWSTHQRAMFNITSYRYRPLSILASNLHKMKDLVYSKA